jgi:hypothetical protein
LEQEDTTKYRGVYFLEFHSNIKLDSLENQQEIILNIYKSIKKGKPAGNVKNPKIFPPKKCFYYP